MARRRRLLGQAVDLEHEHARLGGVLGPGNAARPAADHGVVEGAVVVDGQQPAHGQVDRRQDQRRQHRVAQAGHGEARQHGRGGQDQRAVQDQRQQPGGQHHQAQGQPRQQRPQHRVHHADQGHRDERLHAAVQVDPGQHGGGQHQRNGLDQPDEQDPGERASQRHPLTYGGHHDANPGRALATMAGEVVRRVAQQRVAAAPEVRGEVGAPVDRHRRPGPISAAASAAADGSM